MVRRPLVPSLHPKTLGKKIIMIQPWQALYSVLCHTGHVSLHDTGKTLKSAHGLVRKTCSMESRKGEGNLGLRLTNQKAENSDTEVLGPSDCSTPSSPPHNHQGRRAMRDPLTQLIPGPGIVLLPYWGHRTPVGQSWEQFPIDWCHQCQLCTTTM